MLKILRWLFGEPEISRDARHARMEAIRQEMHEHPVNRGESVGRRESRRIGERFHFWRSSWDDRERGK